MLQGGAAVQHFWHINPHVLLNAKSQQATSWILKLGTTFHKAHRHTKYKGKFPKAKTSANSEASGKENPRGFTS